MSTGPENYQNPYDLPLAGLIGKVLTDPTINSFEHEVNWPRFKALLPPPGNIRSVLDFGCGPGNFTRELADMYPKAVVVGADRSEDILPAERQTLGDRLRFVRWDGYVPGNVVLREELLASLGVFDLVVAKLSLHYMQKDFSYIQGWSHLLRPRARVALSLPHPQSSYLKATQAYTNRWQGAVYEAEVGNTGARARMVHRSTADWIGAVHTIHGLAGHRPVINEVGEEGRKKRLNILFCPPHADVQVIASQVARCEGIDGPGYRDRLLGSLGLSRLSVARNSRGKTTAQGNAAWTIKAGQVLRGQKEAEYYVVG